MTNIDQLLKNAFPNIEKKWDKEIIPVLKEYIKIPNKSPMFDANWHTNGYMHEAMELIKNWCEKQAINNITIEVLENDKRTPLLFIEIPGQSDETILLYGHMDKQPEMSGWDNDLGPWKPVLKDEKLYGRGSADDGYAVFAALSAIQTLQNKIPHARCVIIIEACEESGSYDLPFYLKQLQKRINNPNLIICLDSFSGNYEQMWSTTSLRGLVGGELYIEVMKQGIHSGLGSGVVPSPLLILRELLNRVEDTKNGEILLKEFFVDIPHHRISQAQEAANFLGKKWLTDSYTLTGNTKPLQSDIAEIILARTWRPALSITGIDGLPSTANAGNVTVPNIRVKLSLRIPPTCDPKKASDTLKHILEKNPPHDATVTYTPEDIAPSWHAPKLSQWLAKASDQASQLFFDKPTAYLGEGGTIPFMGMLGEMFPQSQFLITGVLGPKSNAHGPNEFLHIPFVKRLTGCIAAVIAAHFQETK